MDKFFETVSFHVVKPCNMSCKFCYATFNEFKVARQLPKDSAYRILRKLKNAGVEKVTFAGGEPMLYKHLDDTLEYAKMIGLTTSIITNGSLITTDWLYKMKGSLDWIGLSIDSLNAETNEKTGRVGKNGPLSYIAMTNLVMAIRNKSFKFKINTVVNAYNKDEDMNDFIAWAKPDRWKIFQALKVVGQNEGQFDEIKVSDEKFKAFLKRHSKQHMVPENNELMTGSYLLIDPLGRMYENSQGKHTYSRSLVDNSIEDCLSDIHLNRDMFIKRGGIYNW